MSCVSVAGRVAELVESLILHSALIQHLLQTTDPLIQVALINALVVVQQRYPTSSALFTNELLDFARSTSKRSSTRTWSIDISYLP
jgi:hypothetical protein